jgi:rod shape determining protein RodA
VSAPPTKLLRPPSPKPVSFLNIEGTLRDFLRRTDWLAPAIILALVLCGVGAIYATGSDRVPQFLSPRSLGFAQLKFAAIGLGAYCAVSLLEPRLLDRWAWVLYWLGILTLAPIALCALANVNIAPFITARLGARRWISLPGFSVQPSEFVKITTLILLAHIIGRGVLPAGQLTWPERKIATAAAWVCHLRIFWLRRFTPPLWSWLPLLTRTGCALGLPFALILAQPDLGSALTYIPMMFALLFVAGIPMRFFAFVLVAAVPVFATLAVDLAQYAGALRVETERASKTAAIIRDPSEEVNKTFKGFNPFLRNYQRSRLMTMVAPDLIDPLGIGKSWQPRQARMAVANGGFEGLGFQQGELVRKGWLPEAAAHNDFIFACIAEEWGLQGGLFVLGLFASLIALALRTGAAAANKFGLCVCAGVAALTLAHVFQNIGMNVGIMPVTGVSLPFLSYGGSFILSCFLLFGLVQSVHRSSRPLVVEEPDNSDFQAVSQRSPRFLRQQTNH